MAPGYYRSRERNPNRAAAPYRSRCSVHCVVCKKSCPPHHRPSLPSAAQQPMFCRYPAAGRRLICCNTCYGHVWAWTKQCASYPPSQLPPVVLPSLLPNAGKGLFATRSYKDGEFIASFSGELLKADDLPDPSKGEYVLQLRKDLFLNSRYLRPLPGDSGPALARYANQASAGESGNSRLVICHRPLRASLRCRGKISAGEEITTNYGWSCNTKRDRGVK